MRTFANKYILATLGFALFITIFGLVYSRALLSIGSILLAALSLLFGINKTQQRFTLLAIVAILIFPIFSIFYSENEKEATERVLLKLPLIACLAAFTINFSKQQVLAIIAALTIVCLAHTIETFVYYLQNSSTINATYLQAKVIPNVFDDDHIRFSWLIALVVVLLNYAKNFLNEKFAKIVIWIVIIWFVFFLHLLAAKTGLLCLYVFAFFFLLKGIATKNAFILKSFLGFLILACCLVFTLPTLKNRIQYIKYDFSFYSKGTFISGLSDGARVLSIKAGVDIFKQNWVWGVGIGDLNSHIKKWHQNQSKQTQDYEQFNPTNQFIIYAAACGILGLLGFCFGMVYLLLGLLKQNFYTQCLAILLLIPLLTDDSFERQTGVLIFVLIFNLGWWLVRISKK